MVGHRGAGGELGTVAPENSLEGIRAAIWMGLDGVETYYSSYDDPTRKQLSKLAIEIGLLQTGGSDYHGDMKPGLNLGTGWENKPLNVPDEMGFKLSEKYESIK